MESPQCTTSELGGKIIVPCIPAFIYGIVRLFRYSPNDWQGWVLVIGALLAFAGSVTYGVTILDNKKSLRNMLFAFMGFFPYLYGCFIVFYKGFWSFKFLFTSFSLGKLIIPIIWIVIGYQIVKATHILTEFGKGYNFNYPPK